MQAAAARASGTIYLFAAGQMITPERWRKLVEGPGPRVD
jgi:hypothetical protein